MSLYDRYGTNKNLEEEGTWMDMGDGVGFKIRRFRSKTVQEVKKKAERPYENILKRGEEIPEDIATKLLVEQISKGVVVDWRGVQDREGKDMPFTYENAKTLFNDLPDLMLEIFQESVSRDRFKNQADEDAGKN